jgi:hypothetical protein
MEKNKIFSKLLRQLKKLDTQIKEGLSYPYYWRDSYGKKMNQLYRKVWSLKDEFAKIGYTLNPITRKVNPAA